MNTGSRLFEAYNAGDIEVFDKIYLKYAPYVEYIVRKHLEKGVQNDIDDVCQICWLSIVKRSGTYDPSRMFRPWLRACVIHSIIDYRRLGSLMQLGYRSIAQDSSKERAVPLTEDMKICPIKSPEEVASTRELQGIVRRAVKKLPEIYKNVIVKTYFEGLSMQEYILQTGLNRATADSQSLRAHEILEKSIHV